MALRRRLKLLLRHLIRNGLLFVVATLLDGVSSTVLLLLKLLSAVIELVYGVLRATVIDFNHRCSLLNHVTSPGILVLGLPTQQSQNSSILSSSLSTPRALTNARTASVTLFFHFFRNLLQYLVILRITCLFFKRQIQVQIRRIVQGLKAFKT